MALSLPSPSAVFDLTRNAVDQAMGSAAMMASVPARAFGVLDSIEALVTRINGVVDRAEALLERTDEVVDAAQQAIDQVSFLNSAATAAIDDTAGITAAAATLVGQAQLITTRAATVVTRAEATAETAGELLEVYEPALRSGAPKLDHFVSQLTTEEVDAAVALIDQLPQLAAHLTNDILPILATLDRVGPDIHALLDVTRDLKQAVAGIPGLRRLQRRGADRLGEPNGNA